MFSNERPPFNNLCEVSDCTLAAGATIEHQINPGTILLPIVGALIISSVDGEKVLECGELMVFNEATKLQMVNGYDNNLINYMLISFKAGLQPGFGISIYSFDLDKNKNEILDIVTNGTLRIAIGKFQMRRETEHFLLKEKNNCFCTVIQGSFEIEGRLLHERDALAVWGTEAMEIESLSNESILLMIEQEHLSGH